MVFLPPKYSNSKGPSGIRIGYRQSGRQYSIGSIVLSLYFSMIVPVFAIEFTVDTGIAMGTAALAQSRQESTNPSTSSSTSGSFSGQLEAGSDEDEDIKSVGEVIQDGQLAHEKILVDRFLFGVSLIFLLIAFLLFRSLPPKGKEAGES